MKSLVLRVLGVAGNVWTFYAPLLRNLFAGAAQALLPLALEIVRGLATSDAAGAEKREVALEMLRKAAIAQGVDATESLLRFTVESAVQRMKISS